MKWMWLLLLSLSSVHAQGGSASFLTEDPVRARVVVAHHPGATQAFVPQKQVIRPMVDVAIATLMSTNSAREAWRKLVSTQDTVGIKVYCAPGPNMGTRVPVVAAVIEGLIDAGIPPARIVVWDKHRADLRTAGYFTLEREYGVRVEASATDGYDEKVSYQPERPIIGQLVWGDVEFGRKGDEIGRKSFLSKLAVNGMTKIINITPLLNHYRAGVCGNLYSLAMGSVDNNIRFETDAGLMAEAIPEIYNLEKLGDKVALNVVDALICQYQGQQKELLHYSTPLNEIRFSKDPVALDVLSLQELEKQRKDEPVFRRANHQTLYANAALLDLGINDPSRIEVERLSLK